MMDTSGHVVWRGVFRGDDGIREDNTESMENRAAAAAAAAESSEPDDGSDGGDPGDIGNRASSSGHDLVREGPFRSRCHDLRR